jgi:hypothetical protein
MRKLYLAATPLVLLLAATFAYQWCREGSKPADLAELVAAAEADGLFWSTGSGNFPLPHQCCSVVISETPITWDEAGHVYAGRPSGWKGRARAYAEPYPLFGSDPQYVEFAGDIMIVGDPDFVRRIAELSRLR